MTLAAGSSLGPYDIVAPLGRGGMGEVYLARDPRLRRDVALKILPATFAHDPDRVVRFQREAEALASLNHPHVAAIYKLGETAGVRFLVLELVEGQTLAERLAHGPLDSAEALRIAMQLVEALDAAHAKGIVHRDLKPSNVMLTRDGSVKVLDFGLARLLDGEVGGAPAPGLSETPTHLASMPGVVMGTPAYMSPEQASGQPVDKRTDIWAFGVVLYEMLTGRRPFGGHTRQEALAATIGEEPDVSRIPPHLRPLVRRCLTRDPRRRLRDIGDALLLIEDGVDVVRAPRPWRRRVPAAVALVAVGLLAATSGWWRAVPVPAVTRFEIGSPAGGIRGDLMLSPDGRQLAFTALDGDGRRLLWVRNLESLVSRPLPGTEFPDFPSGGVSWSPDSRSLLFTHGSELKRTDASGMTAPVTLARLRSRAGWTSWSPQGVILIGNVDTVGPIWRVPETGGDVSAATADDGWLHAFPQFLPDGRRFLYMRLEPGVSADVPAGFHIGTIDAPPGDEPSEVLLTAVGQVVPADAGGGRLVFMREGRLLTQPFDARRQTLAGEPLLVAADVGNTGRLGHFAVSPAGTLAYLTQEREEHLTWFDRTGAPLEVIADSTNASFARVVGDGSRVAFDRAEIGGTVDIWVADQATSITTRLTFERTRDEFPIWSPDGSRILFRSTRGGGVGDLYGMAADGTGEAQLVLGTDREKWPDDWSPDGQYAIYEETNAEGREELWLLPMTGGGEPSLLVRAPGRSWFGQFSPDGRFVAHQNDGSGRFEIYVRPFTAPGTGAAIQVSSGGGERPLWRGDGLEIIYVGPDRTLMAVEVVTEPRLAFGRPRPLFRMPDSLEPNMRVAISPDAERFLIRAPAGSRQASMTVVLNWQAALRR